VSMNRLQWLFTSQTFLLTAFVVLITRDPEKSQKYIASDFAVLLPVVGMCFCALVAGAIFAADKELGSLADTRQSLSIVINAHRDFPVSALRIPKVGYHKRDHPWTRVVGALPHQFLPGILLLLWLFLFLKEIRIIQFSFF
jgi:hypothetical protein